MAGSPNAFIALPRPPFDVLAERDGNARPTKRPRLSEDAVAAIQTQSAQAATSLEVDHMILDYTAYRTIMACFISRDPTRQSDSSCSLSSCLAMSDAFLSIFKARHATYKADPELRLRILLLKLVTLVSQRLTSNPTVPPRAALDELRASNAKRARDWIGSSDRLPSASFDIDSLDADLSLSTQELERNRAHVLNERGVPAEDEQYEDAFYGTSACVSLLDILPLFMRVSAVRNNMSSSNLTDTWMRLACDLMLQACLEQYLIYGAQGSDAVDEAFAWGYKDNEEEAQANRPVNPTDENDETNEMFEDDIYATEVEGWSDAKNACIAELFPSTGVANESGFDIVSHLEMLTTRHPMAKLEASLLKFLEALSGSIPVPVLVQLEGGKLNGMTAQQTQDFLVECGIGTARLFEIPA